MALTAVMLVDHEPGLPEDPEVPADRGATDLEGTGDGAGRPRPAPQHGQDVPAHRIGDGSDHVHGAEA